MGDTLIDDLKRLRDNYYEMFKSLDDALRSPDEAHLTWIYKDLERLRTNNQEAIERIEAYIGTRTPDRRERERRQATQDRRKV